MGWTVASLGWILLWVVVGSLYVLLVRRGIDYVDHFHLTALYFAIASVLVFLPFREQIAPVLSAAGPAHGALFLGVLTVQILVYWFSRNLLIRPVSLIRAHPRVYWLRMDYRYLVSKPFEILFQQLMVLSLVISLHEAGLGWLNQSVIFVGAFALVHVPIIPLVGRRFGYYYLGFSVAAGLLFPWIILRYPDGFVYSYLIHWVFYLGSAVLFWLLPGRGETGV